MSEIPTLRGRPEAPEDKALREWFEKAALASLDTLEGAARTIVGLVTGLIGLLLGVLALDEAPLPSYLWLPGVRPLGVAAIVTLLAALACGLAVLLPRRIEVSPHRPDEQAEAFHRRLANKSLWLTLATVAFGLGLALLGAILIVTLLTAV